MYRVGIVTLSDKGASGQREDASGPLIKDLLPKDQYEVIRYVLLPDDKEELKKELIDMADHLKLDLVLTTGEQDFRPEILHRRQQEKLLTAWLRALHRPFEITV